MVIRGTKKFLDRVGRPLSEPPPSTTVLGDWYANVLFSRPQAALYKTHVHPRGAVAAAADEWILEHR